MSNRADGDIEVAEKSAAREEAKDVAGYCNDCFCETWATTKPEEDRGNTNEALDARLKYLEVQLLGVYPDEDDGIKSWFKNERKLFGYIPILRTITLYGVISCIWGALDFALALCTQGLKAIFTFSIVLCGIYCVWALFYDRVVEIPPTYTYMHRRTEMYRWCGFAIMVPLWFAFYAALILTVVLVGIACYAFAYVDTSVLFEFTCPSFFDKMGGRRELVESLDTNFILDYIFARD